MSRKTVTPSVKSTTGITVIAVMSPTAIAVSNPLYHTIKGPATINQPEIPLAGGTYAYEVPELGSKGYKDRTIITVSNGIIVSCVWDSLDAESNGEQRLNMDGQYAMTDNGPIRKVQADSTGKYVVGHQKVEGLVNREGYATDAISTVSINVYPPINGTEEYLEQTVE